MHKPSPSILAGSSLFLDFDGTLVELAETPDAIRVEDDVKFLLEMLRDRLSGRLALLSGRALADVRSFFHPIAIAAGGSHGLEIAHAGEMDVAVTPSQGLAEAVVELRELEVSVPGVLIEEKPGGVAVHYRRASDAEAICLETASRLARKIGMGLQRGKMVVELKPTCANKGEALKQFMSVPPFAGTTPIFIGDDVTDEDGFAAARSLGGAGILVGSIRPTNAIYRLDDVSEVRHWLATAGEQLS